MTKNDLMADLEYASQIAKDGANTPLFGGPIGLMWGLMLTLILGYQYLVLSGTLNIPEVTLVYAWSAYGLIGAIGSSILGKKIEQKPGSNSVANRVEQYVWTMFVGALGAILVGVIFNMIAKNGDQTLWNSVMVFAFAGQGMAYGVVAKITKMRLLHVTSFISFTFAAIAMMLVNTPLVYLIGSVGCFLTIVIPSLILMQKAR